MTDSTPNPSRLRRAASRLKSATMQHGLAVVPRGVGYVKRRVSASVKHRLGMTADAAPRRTLTSAEKIELQQRADSLRDAPSVQLIVLGDQSQKAAWKQTQRSLKQIIYPWLDIQTGHTPDQLLSGSNADFVGFVEIGDEVSPDALIEFAEAISENAECDLIYGDENRISKGNREHSPWHKPSWSPELLLSQNYLSRLTLMRTACVRKIGGPCAEAGAAWEYDLLLRVGEVARSVVRVPEIVYHRHDVHGSGDPMQTSDEMSRDARKVAKSALTRRYMTGTVEPTDLPNTHALHVRPQRRDRVSIVIPTRDRAGLLKACVESVLAETAYPNLEVIIADNDSCEAETLELFESWASDVRIRMVPVPGEFNFSRVVNAGVAASNSPYLVLLNNDMTIIAPNWLDVIVAWLDQSEVGIVGAKLNFPNDTIQHAGIIMRGDGPGPKPAFHHLKFQPHDAPGPFGMLKTTRNYSAVTGACLAVTRKVWDEVDGFDERLAVAYNDVDFCLSVREAGYRIVYSPQVELYHHESASRGTDKSDNPRWQREQQTMLNKWGEKLGRDPFYNPNLTLTNSQCGVRDFTKEPRTDRPQRRAA
ncbi:glycosyltransferase family 2 protein [Thalassoroseus pseudoceratinae]|uniref:glycosyltransferase family 2 protein n=1 Tax=Thalassoroseus pseudoceratinae TaxID=2713176 RepID=UPI001423B236|nr:glycosyltransferase family 2 protein [Thalassoroseus pseudoceratinae]